MLMRKVGSQLIQRSEIRSFCHVIRPSFNSLINRDVEILCSLKVPQVAKTPYCQTEHMQYGLWKTRGNRYKRKRHLARVYTFRIIGRVPSIYGAKFSKLYTKLLFNDDYVNNTVDRNITPGPI